MTIAFLILCGFGVLTALFTTAPWWDDERQAPADEAVAVGERA